MSQTFNVAAILDAQPFIESNDGTRVWQLFQDGVNADEAVAAILALASTSEGAEATSAHVGTLRQMHESLSCLVRDHNPGFEQRALRQEIDALDAAIRALSAAPVAAQAVTDAALAALKDANDSSPGSSVTELLDQDGLDWLEQIQALQSAADAIQQERVMKSTNKIMAMHDETMALLGKDTVLRDALMLACERIADGPQEYHEANTADGWSQVFIAKAAHPNAAPCDAQGVSNG